MRILLAQTHWLTERHIQPMGLLYLAAVLRKQGHSVRIIDAEVQGFDNPTLARRIVADSPDVVGLTGTTAQAKRCFAVARMVKDAMPQAFVVLGGAHASALPEESLREGTALDAVVFGEGEVTALELMHRLEGGESLEGLPGTAYRRNGEVVKNPPRALIKNLDELPFPAWDLIPMHEYVASTWFPTKVKQYVNIFTSRGCPYECTFCGAKTTWTRKFRARSAANVIAEIVEAKGKLGIPNFFFSDDLFTVQRKRVVEVCEKLLEHKLNITWTCLSRVNTVDLELLKLMKAAGCYLITFGIESGSQQVLDNLKKGTTVEQAIKAVEMTRQAGIKVFGSIMVGSPGETKETVEATIKLVKKLKLDEVGIGVTTAYPGTDLYDTYSPGVTGIDWDKALAFNPSEADRSSVFIRCTDLEESEIDALYHRAMRKTILASPRLVARRLGHLRSPRHFWHSMVAGVKLLISG